MLERNIIWPQRRIGIDGFSLSRNDSGIEVYTRELITGVASTGLPVEVYGFSKVSLEENASLVVRNAEMPAASSTFTKLKWELHDIKRLISKEVSIFHSPHFILPLNTPTPKKVVTVHDLAFIKRPEFFDWKTRSYYKLFLAQSLRQADGVICISDSCKQDLVELFPETKNKVFRVHNGFRNFGEIAHDDNALVQFGISPPFILMIGTLNPRKNLTNGILAFERLAREKDVDLVIVGDIRNKTNLPGTDNARIHYTGFVTEKQLASLYKHSSLLLFPSYYEGFGFPVLEAMSCDIPVVTASNSSLPEIAGYPKEFYCDPSSPKDIAEKIALVLSADSRKALIEHGRENIKRFSWEKMVKETISVYDQV
ncbi:glycosyltransferase family 4 protein [Pseudochryseolinea flava]|uniref:Glycosyltransferase family 1 protein n=1 Tax=Pseudochryseolinea flava TaxID=2059302 RepID=A0A364XZ44_9BACT|nr:glycosyltransferase family 1 protein [Pseudochryseolinea flava]RAV99753.1 hypothetical protein DQQ10_17045 [Pseudochryseolinea flava]